MRKRLQQKKHSRALCKPFKMRGTRRWKNRYEADLRQFERDRLDYRR
jgi:hypothetical protein